MLFAARSRPVRRHFSGHPNSPTFPSIFLRRFANKRKKKKKKKEEKVILPSIALSTFIHRNRFSIVSPAQGDH
jgi:hypothetical protein